MSPLYLFNSKLLVKNNKLASHVNCCCSAFGCKSRSCGCDDYNASHTQLWNDITEYVANQGYTCGGIPVNCGQWKIFGPQRSCCSKPCYDIWNAILEYVGYDLNTRQTKSPSELDILCPNGITVTSTFFPVRDATSGSNQVLFDNVRFANRNRVMGLTWPVDVPPVDGLPLNSVTNPDFTFRTGQSTCPTRFMEVDFVHLKSNGNLNVSNPLSANPTENDLLIEMFNNGSEGPSTVTTNYTDIINCRNCFGALYKLGTKDFFGRTENPDFVNTTLINAVSGEVKNTTDFTFSVPSGLPLSACMTNKFQGSSVQPYSILTDELKAASFYINSDSDPHYFNFGVKYKYEVTWDDPNSIDAEWFLCDAYWRVIYGPPGSANPTFQIVDPLFFDSLNNTAPTLVGASTNSLKFDSNGNVTITLDWGPNGIKIGNNDCDFLANDLWPPSAPPWKSSTTINVAPTLTATATGGTGAEFSVTLASPTGTFPSQTWSIASVEVTKGGTGYTHLQPCTISAGSGTVVSPANLAVRTWEFPLLTVDASGAGGTGATFELNYAPFGNDAYGVLSVTVTNGGSGYSNGGTILLVPGDSTRNWADNTTTPVALPYQTSGGEITQVSNAGLVFWYRDRGIAQRVRVYDAGKYYATESNIPSTPTIRPISGPCIGGRINNPSNPDRHYAVTMDVWHPGPCGISEILKTETSANTPWQNISGSDGRISGTTFSSISTTFTQNVESEYLLIYNGSKYVKYTIVEYLTSNSVKIATVNGGDPLADQNIDRQFYIGGTYYNDLIENTYKKFWIVYDHLNLDNEAFFIGRTNILTTGCGPSTPPTGSIVLSEFCPCYMITQLGFGVIKYEGCEARGQNWLKIPLRQWEMDITSNPGWTINPVIYSRECEPLGTDWNTVTNESLHSRRVCSVQEEYPPILYDKLDFSGAVDHCEGAYYYDYANLGYDPYIARQQISTTNSPYSIDTVSATCYTFPYMTFPNCVVVTNGVVPWRPYDNIDCP